MVLPQDRGLLCLFGASQLFVKPELNGIEATTAELDQSAPLIVHHTSELGITEGVSSGIGYNMTRCLQASPIPKGDENRGYDPHTSKQIKENHWQWCFKNC